MRRTAAVLLAVLLLVPAGCGGDARQPDVRASTKGAETAARKAVVSMTTYDYASLDKDFAWVDRAGTPKFRKDFADASAPVRKLVAQLKARAKGSVVDAATDYTDPTHVRVLLFVDQTITNAKARGQADFEQLRVKMWMVRSHDRWLVDKVEVLNRSTGPAS